MRDIINQIAPAPAVEDYEPITDLNFSVSVSDTDCRVASDPKAWPGAFRTQIKLILLWLLMTCPDI